MQTLLPMSSLYSITQKEKVNINVNLSVKLNCCYLHAPILEAHKYKFDLRTDFAPTFKMMDSQSKISSSIRTDNKREE